MDAQESPKLETKRSTFVTVLSWIFICLSGFGTLISLLQNVMINFFMFPQMNQMTEEFGKPDMADKFPPFFKFMFFNIRFFFLLFLIIAVSILVSSIGLLLRKNWARITFIVLMALGILWNIFGMVAQFFMMGFIDNFPVKSSESVGLHFNTMFIIFAVFTSIFCLGLSILFGWIIKKLLSTDIKAEFGY